MCLTLQRAPVDLTISEVVGSYVVVPIRHVT